MVDNFRPLLPVLGSSTELPPEYSRAPPPLSQSLSYRQSTLIPPHRFLPGDREDSPPPFVSELSVPVTLPPKYSAFDETINSFTLLTPLIHTRSTSGATRPRYQLSQECSKSGKKWRLRIRRLLPTESRRLSVPTTYSLNSPVVDYDDDTTLYIIEDLGALNPFKGQSVEIRGRRAKTLPGHIELRNVGGARGDNRNCEFWHMTRNPANDFLKKENEKKMNKYGYRAEDEWKRKKLFTSSCSLGTATKVEWKNDEGQILVTEEGDSFNIVGEVDQRFRDALVTCWAARRWAAGSLNWQRAGHLDLARARTAGT